MNRKHSLFECASPLPCRNKDESGRCKIPDSHWCSNRKDDAWKLKSAAREGASNEVEN